MVPGKTKTAAILDKLAHAHPDVTEAIACKGTSIEALTYNVRKKAFLFVMARDGALQLRFKLGESLPEMQKLAASDPAAFEAGKIGWCKASFPDSKPPEQKLLKRWIDESYAQFAPARPRE